MTTTWGKYNNNGVGTEMLLIIADKKKKNYWCIISLF